MSKGPSGSTTTTTVNPTAQAQLPYMEDLWGQAQSLYQNNPLQYYPGQTLAPYMPPNPYLTTGYEQLYQQGQNTQSGLLPGANAAWGSAVSGGMGGQNSPAYPYYDQYASGSGYLPQSYQQAAAQAQQGAAQYAGNVGAYADPLAGLAYQAGANNNFGLNSLMNTASGAYLNSNPYIDQAIQAAQDPVTRNYQTAIAPTTDALFSGSGRYGSGAMAGAVNTGQQNLVRGLGDISTNMMNANYARERQLMDQAASQYGQLYNAGLGLGMQGLSNAAAVQGQAGNQYWQGQQAALNALNQYGTNQRYGISGLEAAYNTQNDAVMRALQMYPQLATAQNIGAQTGIAAGTGVEALNQQFAAYQQKQLEDQMARFYGEQNAPYDTLAKFSSFLGNPVGGSNTQSQPYFSNPIAGALSGAMGLTGIGRNLGLLGGASAPLAGAGAPFLLPGMAGASIPGVAGGASSIAGALGMAAPAAWIICTELTRQGRLPRKWWAAGTRTFAAYPEIAKRGYYVWAIPSVRHLRRHPHSLYSRLLAKVFSWRAEDIAARRGVEGARKLWRGRAVTAALVIPCLVLGAVCREQDWQSVYNEEAA